MKKFELSIKKKTNYTSIKFVSFNKYSNLAKQGKVDKNITYFIDDSINDTNGEDK